jgi:RHS repeat-associated protein
LGRVTSLDGWNHTYSCDGLLLSSEPSAPAEGSRRSTHAYDALGRRVRTVVQAYVGGQWTAFSTTERDFLGRLPLGIETSFADGSAKSWRFLRGPDASGTLEGAGGARGVLAVLKDASSWKAVAADTLGNVLALAGTNGDFTRRTFDPWGNPLVRNASGSLRAATLTERRADYDALPLAWASQEVDPDTGLTHYHFREYSPSLGGWLTTDPIGLAGGYLNLRSYIGNRPTDALDVWGEKMEYPPKPEDAKVHYVSETDYHLQGERGRFESNMQQSNNPLKNNVVEIPNPTYSPEIYIDKANPSAVDVAGGRTLLEHEKQHAKDFYDEYKQMAERLNKYEGMRVNDGFCKDVFLKIYRLIKGYHSMRVEYLSRKLHSESYPDQEIIRKEFKPYSNSDLVDVYKDRRYDVDRARDVQVAMLRYAKGKGPWDTQSGPVKYHMDNHVLPEFEKRLKALSEEIAQLESDFGEKCRCK